MSAKAFQPGDLVIITIRSYKEYILVLEVRNSNKARALKIIPERQKSYVADLWLSFEELQLCIVSENKHGRIILI